MELVYLKTNKLLTYFDALNKEFGKGKKPHIFLMPDDFSILEVAYELCETKMKQCRPAMLYVDIEAYPNLKSYMDRLMNEYKIILIVRCSNGDISGYNMQVLDKELNLYYMEGKNDGI